MEKEKSRVCVECGNKLLPTEYESCDSCDQTMCKDCHTRNDGLCNDCLVDLHE